MASVTVAAHTHVPGPEIVSLLAKRRVASRGQETAFAFRRIGSRRVLVRRMCIATLMPEVDVSCLDRVRCDLRVPIRDQMGKTE